jgi:ATP synthase I chain
MIQRNETEFYDQVVRRISRIILALGLIGATITAVLKGIPSGFAFLIGSAVSFASFWGWRYVVDAFGPNPKQRKPAFFVLRLFLLLGGAYVIIKFLGLNVAAAAMGLLVSGAAVVLEIIYELIYARA